MLKRDARQQPPRSGEDGSGSGSLLRQATEKDLTHAFEFDMSNPSMKRSESSIDMTMRDVSDGSAASATTVVGVGQGRDRGVELLLGERRLPGADEIGGELEPEVEDVLLLLLCVCTLEAPFERLDGGERVALLLLLLVVVLLAIVLRWGAGHKQQEEAGGDTDASHV